jgi:cysteine desulfurase/selenocysteine lyase
MVKEKKYDYESIRKDFPLYKKNPDIVFLDSAASALKIKGMIKHTTKYYSESGSNIHRGLYDISEKATAEYEYTRQLVAKFINSDIDEVVFTKGTTDGLNLVISSLGRKYTKTDEVIVSELEHHSSILPWRDLESQGKITLKYVSLINNRITVEEVAKQITHNTKVICLTHVANTLGYKTPIEEIVKLARKSNILVILDCAQSITFNKIDVKSLDVDFLVFSAHKLYGPNGVGVLYGRKQLLENLSPYEFGGDMVEEVHLDDVVYRDVPYKFEAGTPNIAGVIAFADCIKYINKIGYNKINEIEKELHHYLIEEMSKLDYIEIYNQDSEAAIVLFNVKGGHPHDVSSILNSKNVCVRAGHHCAMMVSDRLGIMSSLRASLNIYNSKKDCDELVEGLKLAKSILDK